MSYNPEDTKVEDKILALDPNSLMSKIYQKSFNLRSQNKGKFRDQAYVLEEMAKEIQAKNTCLVLGQDQEIKPIKNVDKVMEFLVLMSGQATIYDTDKRKETLSRFSKKYLDQSLRKTPSDGV